MYVIILVFFLYAQSEPWLSQGPYYVLSAPGPVCWAAHSIDGEDLPKPSVAWEHQHQPAQPCPDGDPAECDHISDRLTL